MHPISTLLIVLGYGLALPVAVRWRTVRPGMRNVALVGHQVGVGIAAAGWLMRGLILLAVIHLVWMFAARFVLGRLLS